MWILVDYRTPLEISCLHKFCVRARNLDLLEADPPRRHPPEESWNCTVQAAVSQPLPLPSLSEAVTCTYVMLDFDSAQPATNHTVNDITADALRPPEIIPRGPWDEKVDIWTFGCLVVQSAPTGPTCAC